MKNLVATLVLLLVSLCVGFARRTRKSSAVDSDLVVDFSDLAIQWVEQSERGPTISGHFMVHVHAALFDAYAAFEDETTGAITDLDEIRVESLSGKKAKAAAQQHAMASAAYDVITTLGQTLLDQKYLEIENGEDASERLPLLLGEADWLLDKFTSDLGLKQDQLLVAEEVSEAVSSAILTSVTQDGSNYQNDYADTTGYAVRPMFEPVPVVSKQYYFTSRFYSLRPTFKESFIQHPLSYIPLSHCVYASKDHGSKNRLQLLGRFLGDSVQYV